MHLNQFNYEQQYQLIAPDGTVLWYGTVIFGLALRVASTEASATIASGGAVIYDGPNSTFGYDANLGTSDPGVLLLSGKAVVDANSVAFAGVAAEPILAAKAGLVAGPGSITTVRCTSGAIAVGGWIGGSGTAALCAAIAYSASVPVVQGKTLGMCIKANANVTGSLYAAAVIVNTF